MGAGSIAVSSCSVFPDEARLPLQVGGIAGESVGDGATSPGGGSGGAPGAGSINAAAGSAVADQGGVAGTSTLGGAGSDTNRSGSGGSGAAGSGASGTASVAGTDANAGAAGASAGASAGGTGGSQPTCAVTRVVASADTWIDAADPSASRQGQQAVLALVGGAVERRLLLTFELPAVKAGKLVAQATLVLHLRSNADVTRAERRLRAYALAQAFDETAASWESWGSGSKRHWTTPGGDLADVLAEVSIGAGTASGDVSFDMTQATSRLASTQAIPLSLLVLEAGAVPTAPAELAFDSRESNASRPPVLAIELCDP